MPAAGFPVVIPRPRFNLGFLMIDPEVQKLLTLQARELKRDEIDKELAAVPLKIQEIERKKQAARDQFDQAKQTLRSLEAQRKTLENEIASNEAQVTKYKNQQLSVKKNEEYQALTHEIDTTQAKIGDLETEELEVMEQIDVESERLKAIEGTFDDEIAKMNGFVHVRKTCRACLSPRLARYITLTEVPIVSPNVVRDGRGESAETITAPLDT